MNWQSVTLEDVAIIERTGVDPSLLNEETSYVGLEHIESGGRLLEIKPVANGELKSTKFAFGPRHILYGKLRPYLAKIALPEFAGICSTDILPILPGPDIDRNYLCQFLRQPTMIEFAASRSEGANLPRLSPKALAKFEIPLPPLDEQKRIAAILDKADQLRQKRRRAIALLDTLTQSIFLEMFGDPVSNPKEWPWRKLGEVGKLDRGVSKHRPRNDPKLLSGSHPLIQTGDVANSGGYIRTFSATYSDFGLSQSKLWPTGTLCITIAANIASTGILKFSACFPDSVVGFSSSSAGMNQYVRVWIGFLKENLERIAPAVAQKNINLAILRELDIPLPSDEALLKFNLAMEKLVLEQESANLHKKHADTLFASLQYRAFSGQL